jgi:threonine/homoserine/homoserine lactone efflux protein
MRQAISDVLPYAVGLAVIPIPIIAVILMLFSDRAKVNGPAFLVGWVITLSAIVAVVYAVSDAADTATDTSASDTSSTLQIVLGVVLVVLAVRKWRHRPAPGAEESMPKWMSAVDSFSPVKAFGLAVVLCALNPKNLILAVGAAALVGQAAGTAYSTSDAIVALVVFVLLSSLTIAIPVVYSLAGGARARATLDGWKTWLAANNATVMTILFLVFGVFLVAKGTGHLS